MATIVRTFIHDVDQDHYEALKARVLSIAKRVSYKDWRIRLTEKGRQDTMGDHAIPMCMFMQWEFDAPDNLTGVPSIQRSRKWYLSPYMSDTEIVNTFYLAAEVAERHESRELFRLDGQSPYNTHIDIVRLGALDAEAEYDHRHEPPPSA